MLTYSILIISNNGMIHKCEVKASHITCDESGVTRFFQNDKLVAVAPSHAVVLMSQTETECSLLPS